MKKLPILTVLLFCLSCLMTLPVQGAMSNVSTTHGQGIATKQKRLSLKERIIIKKIKKLAKQQKTAKKKRIGLQIVGGLLLAALGFFSTIASVFTLSPGLIIVSLLVGLTGVFFFLRGIVMWANFI